MGQNFLKTLQFFGIALRSVWSQAPLGHRAMILRSEISWTRQPRLSRLDSDLRVILDRRWSWRGTWPTRGRDSHGSLLQVSVLLQLPVSLWVSVPVGSNQQVMLAARELEPSMLPANTQTWVNLHLPSRVRRPDRAGGRRGPAANRSNLSQS